MNSHRVGDYNYKQLDNVLICVNVWTKNPPAIAGGFVFIITEQYRAI
jgi:hypothetical protein